MEWIRKTSLVAAAAVLMIGSAGIAHANLIVNGGFETGNFTGWTLSGTDTADVNVVSSGTISYPPHSGNFFAELGSVGGLGFLSQTVSDTAGARYTISLWLASNGAVPNEFDVEWNSATLFDQTNIQTQAYTQLAFNVAGTGSDTLTISERDDPDFLALDDVSVDPVPEPASLALLSISLLGFGFLLRRGARPTPILISEQRKAPPKRGLS